VKFPKPYTLKQIADIINSEHIGEDDFSVLGMNEIHVVEEGDIVFVAATCGNLNSYTFNNDFTEGFDQQFGDTTTGGTGAAGYKVATGVAEIPSMTYNDSVNRQVLIGFVVKEMVP